MSEMTFSNFLPLLVSALLGGFVTLIVVAITNIISRIIKRKIMNYNSLVLLENQLNETIGIIKDDIYLIPSFEKAITTGNIYWSQLKPIPIDKSHYVNLSDIELLNDLFEFFYKSRQINDDVSGLAGGYGELRDAYVNKLINTEHYVLNSKLIAKELDLIKTFLGGLNEDLIDLLIKVRLSLKKGKPFVVKIQEIFNPSISQKISIHEYKLEKNKIKKELDKSSQKSREEISKLVGEQK